MKTLDLEGTERTANKDHWGGLSMDELCSMPDEPHREKICKGCKKSKWVKHFGYYAKSRDGLSLYCNDCWYAYRRKSKKDPRT